MSMVEMKRPIAPKPNAVAKLSSSRTTPRAASCASLAALNWSNSLHVRVQPLLLRFQKKAQRQWLWALRLLNPRAETVEQVPVHDKK